MYIDKLDDKVKMKPVDVKPSICIGSNKKEIVRKVLNLKLVTILKYQDLKIFCKRLCSKLVRESVSD